MTESTRLTENHLLRCGLDRLDIDQILENQNIVDELKKIESIVLPYDITPNDARFIRYDYVRNLIKETTGKDISELS